MNIYDEENRRHSMNGIEIPSVTQVLPKPNFHQTRETMDRCRQEGNENHDLIKMYNDTGGDPGKSRYLQAYDRFIKEQRKDIGKLLMYEKPLFSEKYRFCGKIDSLYEYAIIDVKRSRPSTKKSAALQPSGYNILVSENKIIKSTKLWIIAWFEEGSRPEEDVFKSTRVWNDKAEETFLLYLKMFYIEQTIKRYYD